jgi:hypothetical protein
MKEPSLECNKADPKSKASIKIAARTAAFDLMSYYTGNIPVRVVSLLFGSQLMNERDKLPEYCQALCSGGKEVECS